MNYYCPKCGMELNRLECYSDPVYKCPKCRSEYDEDYLLDIADYIDEEDDQ